MIEDSGGLGGAAAIAGAAERVLGHRVARRGSEHAGLDGRRQPGELDRAHLGPVRAVGGVVAGDRVAGASQPQPARMRRRNGTRQPGGIPGEVVLHPDPVTARHHHRRVRRALMGAALDDDPRLGPLGQAGHQAAADLHRALRAGEVRVLAGERGDARGDGAVPGQRLVHEVEAVGDDLAARPVRDVGQAGFARFRRTAVDLAADVRVSGREHAEEDGQQRGQDHADHPAAHAAELDPLGPQQGAEAAAAGSVAGPGFGPRHRDGLGRHRGTSCAASASKPAGRNSTACLVSSI